MLISKFRAETVSGLRTRYVPQSRIGQGIISIAPWLNLVLLIIFFVLIQKRLVIEPGVVIELPEAALRGGAVPDLAAVVLSVESGAPGVRNEIVIFDDASYRVTDGAQMARLRTALGAAARRSNGALLLEADAHVQHGTLVQLYGLAREAGLKAVNLAARPAANSNPD